MDEFVHGHEVGIRLVFLIGIFASVAWWEVVAPRRILTVSKAGRWFSNIGIVVLNTIVLRLLFPAAAVGFAVKVGALKWGLLNITDVPYWAAVILSAIFLDFVIYLQHVMFHAIPALWRLHMMHHADLDYDVTTGTRFHPIEIVLSMAIKFAAIVVIGAPALGVIVFEILLNGTAMFNHGNIRLPLGLDRVLRFFVVTPDMHRVHHSVFPSEANSNFGFNLPWWDRLLGSYRSQPEAGHDGMTIGIEQFRTPRDGWLDRMLILPLIGRVGHYPINRDDGD